jgi:N-formylmaleamate deformylase
MVSNRTSAGWSRGRLAVTDGHLAYHRTGGGGPALVLSHGLTDNGLCWSRLATALAPDFDVIMLDARGHGDSARMAGCPDPDPARDIAEAVEQLGLRSPIVMGHSVGARATADFAAAWPDIPCKVVLEDPPFLPLPDEAAIAIRQQKFRHHLASLRSLSLAEVEALGRKSSPGWHDDEFPAWAASKRQVDSDAMPHYRTTWQTAIAGIVAPTLLIHGDPTLGGLVTPTLAAEARSLNPNITTVQIRGAGHNIRRESFEDFRSAVVAFLKAS